MFHSGIYLRPRTRCRLLAVAFCAAAMLLSNGLSSSGADRFVEQEKKVREKADQADRHEKLDDAIRELANAMDLRRRDSRPDNADDRRWLQELKDEQALRDQAREMEAAGRISAAAATVEKLITNRNRRLGGKGVPESAADRRWLTTLKNQQTEALMDGLDVAREYEDRWFDRRLEFHDGGPLADEIAKKDQQLKELAERVDKDNAEYLLLKDSIDKLRESRATKMTQLKALAKAQWSAYQSGNREDAAVQARLGLDVRRQIYGPMDPTVGICAVEAAQIEINRGQLFEMSTELLDEASKIFVANYGANHWRVRDVEIQKRELKELRVTFREVVNQAPQIRANIELCQTLIDSGRFGKALEVADKDLQFLSFHMPQRALTLTARTLLNQAAIFRAMGLQARSVPIQASAIAMIRDLYGDEHPEMVSALVQQTSAYRELGDFKQALFTARKAKELCEPVWGKEHIVYAGCLRNLAEIMIDLDQPSEARPIVVSALKIAETDFKQYGTDWTQSFRVLAEIEFRLGRWDNARNFFEHTLKNQTILPGKTHPSYVATLGRLAASEHALKQYDKSMQFSKEAIELSERIRGKEHPAHAELLANVARMCQDRGDFAQAEALFENALKIIRKHLDATFSVLPERQQLTMTNSASEILADYIVVAFRTKRPVNDIYSLVLGWKGAVIAQQQRSRGASKDPRIAPLRAKLDDLSRQLAALALSDMDSKQKPGRDKLIEDLTNQKDRIEGEMTQLGASSAKSRFVDLKEVQAVLPPETVLVDIYEYRDVVIDPKSQDRGYLPRLTAFIVQQNKDVTFVDLGPTQFIRQAVEKWRQQIMRRAGGVSRGLTLVPQKKPTDPDVQIELRRLLWAPIEQRLDPGSLVLLSPESVVSNIPFSALPGTSPGRYLIDDRGIVLVPSPILLPDLLRNDDSTDRPRSMLLIGDVDFGAPPGTTRIADLGTAPVVRSATRSTGLNFPPLPGTERETKQILDLHARQFKEISCHRLTGTAATEHEFRVLAPTSRILHIATHGFFGSQSTQPSAASDRAQGSDRNSGPEQITDLHPGLSSGIALTGANRGSSVSNGQLVSDDGILTALEAAALDLSATEMVVLSACETGLGTSAGGEGLLSLQRAFQVAGAKSTITSLWKVDDAATQSLMVEFYRNLWERRLGKLEALRQAQIAMIERYDPKNQAMQDRGLKLTKPSSDPQTDQRLSPYFWAAFTLSGDWR